jgi:protein transport protein SEC23
LQQQPAELYPQFQTIEYQATFPKQISPPAYIFIIDTCVLEEELSACRAAISKALQTLPEYAHVGLVTFGTHVHVHELGFSECSKSYVFQVSHAPPPPPPPPPFIFL